MQGTGLPGRARPQPVASAGGHAATKPARRTAGRPGPCPRARPRPRGGSTHFGIGVGEVELVQTVLPRVQEAPHGQGPVSAGDRAGQDAAEWAGTPRRRQQGRRGPGPAGWAPPCGLGAGRRAPLSVQPPHPRLRTAPAGSPALTTAGAAAPAAWPSTSGGTSPPARLHPPSPAGSPRHASPPAKDALSKDLPLPRTRPGGVAGTTGDRPVRSAFPGSGNGGRGGPRRTRGSGLCHPT